MRTLEDGVVFGIRGKLHSNATCMSVNYSSAAAAARGARRFTALSGRTDWRMRRAVTLFSAIV